LTTKDVSDINYRAIISVINAIKCYGVCPQSLANHDRVRVSLNPFHLSKAMWKAVRKPNEFGSGLTGPIKKLYKWGYEWFLAANKYTKQS